MKQYSKTSKSGGEILRAVIKTLRGEKISLPIDSHILIAVSGGLDSTVLAHLLIHYGRKVAPKNKIGIVHVNHHWRGEESNDDQETVETLSQTWGVPCHVINLPWSPVAMRGLSWENEARKARLQAFAELAEKLKAIILTAHHGDDLFETLVWKFFSGSLEPSGIKVVADCQIRPFLAVRKKQLKAYAKEQGLNYRNDCSNDDMRFLRNRIRSQLLPQIDEIFPGARQSLINQYLVRGVLRQNNVSFPDLRLIEEFRSVRLRRVHLQNLKLGRSTDLPDGWRVERTDDGWTFKKSKSH